MHCQSESPPKLQHPPRTTRPESRSASNSGVISGSPYKIDAIRVLWHAGHSLGIAENFATVSLRAAERQRKPGGGQKPSICDNATPAAPVDRLVMQFL